MSDLFQTFGFCSVFTAILLIVNLIQRTLDDHPRIQYLFFVIMVPLFFLSFPSTIVFGIIISLYCKIMSKFAVEEEREKQAKIDSINNRLIKESVSMDTVHFLRSNIEVLKEENDNLKSKLTQLHQEKINENDPFVMSLRKSAYEHGWSSGHRSGFYDGYMDCKSDIAQGIDRTDEVCEYAHPAKQD